jgi:PPM family protein phosphatase
MIELRLGTLSRTGGRAGNEDACGYWTSKEGSCFVVSDGAGGHLGGALASEIAVRSILTSFSASPKFDHDRIAQVIAEAQAALNTEKQSHPHLQSMSATVAAILISADRSIATWCQLGDTRIYLFRKGRAHLLSRDHSLAQTLLEAGLSVLTDTRVHPKRSVLYAGLGISSDTEPTIPDAPLALEDGDAFLVCSDGFWERVLERDMEDSLMMVDGPEQWLIRMEQTILGNAPPGFDNYTGVAVWLGSPDESTIMKIKDNAAGATPK